MIILFLTASSRGTIILTQSENTPISPSNQCITFRAPRPGYGVRPCSIRWYVMQIRSILIITYHVM